MTSYEIRKRFLEFFQKRGHAIIPSASLVPENDPSVLFTTAGMQPLMPYFFGEPHLAGKKLVDIQKCVRTVDIEEIGDNTHATFFEMMGNWSLGDYFKKEAIEMSFEFLTSKEEGLGLDPNRLYVTCFEGDENAPKDMEAAQAWKKAGVSENRIYFKGVDSNWWPAVKNGEDTWTGPTGTCSEMFYDVTENGVGDLSLDEFNKADDEQRIVEIWNDVFMEYEKKNGKIVGNLPQKNIDTGAGFERLIAVVEKKGSIFDTDLFERIMSEAKKITDNIKKQRIIADHFRTAVFLIADGVTPSNTDRGYILRRLIRRAVFNSKNRKITSDDVQKLVEAVIKTYKGVYYLEEKKEKIITETNKEIEKFEKALNSGINEFEKFVKGKDEISGRQAFNLYSSYGLPIDVIVDLSKEKNITVNIKEFKEAFKSHQDISRAGSEQKFKGGLAGRAFGEGGEMETKYHTATHLLHQALRDVLGDEVKQMGSNITAERLRFDFSFPRKMTDEEKKKVEDIVNEKISAGIPMQKAVMKKEEALKTGALHFFGDKYGDEVNVYYIGDSLETAYSKEFCGGPHVENTSELASVRDPEGNLRDAKFKIIKEEAISVGVRRIKAVLE